MAKEGERMEIIERAQKWAARGHAGVKRKFTDLPYIVHPEAVVQTVSLYSDDEEVLAAAWMHDLLEDVPEITPRIMENWFGKRVTDLVVEVSKVSTLSCGNRKVRVLMDLHHYAAASTEGKLIKLADTLHNLPTMIRDNPDPSYYVREKKTLVDHIGNDYPVLSSIIYEVIRDYEIVLDSASKVG